MRTCELASAQEQHAEKTVKHGQHKSVRNAGDGLDRAVFANNQAVFRVLPLYHPGQQFKGWADIYTQCTNHFGYRVIRIIPAQDGIQECEE